MNGRNPETERSLVQDSQGNLKKFRKPLLQYLISGLEHPDTGVRSTAADALGALADTETLGDLLPLMVSQDPQLREAALRSAEKIQNSRIDFYHCRTAGCEHCLIRSIAEEALARMRIRDCGISVMQKGGDRMKIGGNVQKGRAGRISGQIMGKDIRRKKGSGRRGRL